MTIQKCNAVVPSSGGLPKAGRVPRNHKFILFSALFVLFVFNISPAYSGGDDDIYTKINKNMDIFGRMYKEIVLNYVDEIETDKFMKAGIDGMLNTLDPYTNFLDESRKDEVDLLTTGRYAGIGITVGMKDSLIVITEVMEGYSAQKEGLRVGDKILEIDGTDMTAKKPGDVRAYVRGTPGSQLKMKIGRGDKILDFVLTRQEIKLKSVTYSGILDGGIGYIKLERFNKNAESEISEALSHLKSRNSLNGIIVDLRDNPGGLLDAAVNVLTKFVDRGSLLVTTKGRKPDSERKYFSTEDPIITKDIPVAVLINDNSASASEIFAGAVQDLDRGVVIGTKSFGKGLVQVYSPLSYDTQLKITNQKYFIPSGRWIQSKNYFKENKYGVFKFNPYYSQTQFKTLNGRIVYAEGGITPDSTVSLTDGNELLDELLSQDMYYRFAEKYVYEHPEVISFTMNQGVIDEFYNFLSQQSFEYTSKAETKTAELSKLAGEKNYSAKVKTLINELESELKLERFRDFERSKPVIAHQLEMEILRKLNKTEQEITAASLNTDLQVQTAASILKDRAVYDGILGK
jgi:carboxyl-terminal processing protease